MLTSICYLVVRLKVRGGGGVSLFCLFLHAISFA